MPVKRTGEFSVSPYIRITLAMGRPPRGRIRGWVAAMVTGGTDNVSEVELIARHGESLRVECADAGFVPQFDQPIAKQSPAARQAAAHWAERVSAVGRY